ncbi:MAG: hypothetical protein JO233_04355 [Candidatus Eremiobacteraeota bacterium]|nr:hypothetical protein [Candidatus Eremiobacteraeota bacterium]
MSERRDVYENELTEEDRPSGAEQEDEAETERLDPDVDSQAGDEFMEDDKEGA